MKKIEAMLSKYFNAPLREGEKRLIVFWQDIEREFIDDYKKVKLDNVKVIHLHENNQFYVKYLLEEKDPKTNYLIYTTMELESEDNWLYDTYLYAKSFYADRISLIMEELSIESHLRETVKAYYPFFRKKSRVERFKALDIYPYTKENIELGIMNVLCNNRSVDFESVLRTVLMDTLVDEENVYLERFEKFFSLDTFWSYVLQQYDYKRKEKSLETLFIHLVMSAFSRTIDEKYIEQYSDFIAQYNRTNAYVFVDYWMHHKEDSDVFRKYITSVEESINLQNVLADVPIEVLVEAEIFPYVERMIIKYIANSVLGRQEDYDLYIEYINKRRTKHFFEDYRPIYEALNYTIKMFAFRKRFTYGIPQNDAKSMFTDYTKTYYEMDFYYRKFYVAFDKAETNNLLLKLKNEVENLYVNWFLGDLGTNWSQVVKSEMEHDWFISGVERQQQFFENFVRPHLEKNERAFVIISDALRYEVGVELAEKLNSEVIGEIELDTLLSVLPSVTKLGMAALLPHQTLTMDENANVLVNDKASSSIEKRKQILESAVSDSIAVRYDDIVNRNKEERRELLKGKKVIYIYHNEIDATGDHADSEMNTFQAVEKTIDELSNIVRIIRNDLSGTFLYITSDHGFLYEREQLEVTDLMDKELLDHLEVKRRYILSYEVKDVANQACISLTSILNNDPPLYVYAPHAKVRYRIQGGGRNFVHGGASLQEVVVPLIKIHSKRLDQKHVQKIEQVNVHLTSTNRRITNSIFTLEFFQTERVVDKRIPRSVTVCFVDESGEKLSNEELIIADLEAENPKERLFKVQFILKNITYDKSKQYYLTIRDNEKGIVLEKIPFTIDLGLISDFDF